jgi:hypothetical protein
MGPKDYLASNVSPPRVGDTQNIAASTSSGSAGTALAVALKGRYIMVQCISATDTDSIAFRFGDSTVTVDYATKHAPELKAGESMQFCLERADTHVAIESNAGTPDFRITGVSPKPGN